MNRRKWEIIEIFFTGAFILVALLDLSLIVPMKSIHGLIAWLLLGFLALYSAVKNP
jgi:hypothetical protein